jgi:hypothetical protein
MIDMLRCIEIFIGLSKRTLLFAIILGFALSSAAFAHVKWFAPYDVPSQPVALKHVFSSTFWLLATGSCFALWAICRVEKTDIGDAAQRVFERFSDVARSHIEQLFRATTAVFFFALSMLGTIILTPELTTNNAVIPWLQAAIAAGMFWRPTMLLAAVGIGVLFVFGVVKYGVFHMMDYPIFLGAAAYLALSSRQVKHVFNLRPLDFARWGAAITLMWASVEKWAYPHWSIPVLQAHPGLTIGLDRSFYMTAAGMTEFALAFALLWSPLVRRLAATALAAMFFSAIFEFGRLDALGHLMIIMILVTIMVDDAPGAVHRPVLAPAYYCAALFCVIVIYYVSHALIYGTTIT